MWKLSQVGEMMMKAEHISEHVWSLKAWVIPIHVWIVIEEDGFTLVDAGIPMMAKGIMKFIKQLNAGPLRRILLTHGHSDHVPGLCTRDMEKRKKHDVSVFLPNPLIIFHSLPPPSHRM